MKIFLTSLFYLSFGYLLSQNANPFDIPVQSTDVSVSNSMNSEVEDIDSSNLYETLNSDTIQNMTNDQQDEKDSLLVLPKVNIQEDNPFDIGFQQSIKEEKTPKFTEIGPKILTKNAPENTKIIALVYSVIMLIILTLAISMDRKKFGFMVQSCINSNNLRTLYRDNKAWTNGQSIILYIFFFLNLAFVIWFLNIKMNLFPNIDLFLILGALVVCYLIRHVVMWSIATVFPLGQEVGLHNFSISLHNMVLGVFLLPFILALEFMPSVGYQTMFYGVLTIILLLYLMRQTKGLFLSFGMRGFNLFYFFVYLCAVEIAPILVVYKMISGAL